MININERTKQTTIESILHVETHGHTKTVTVPTQNMDIIVKCVVNQINLKINAKLK